MLHHSLRTAAAVTFTVFAACLAVPACSAPDATAITEVDAPTFDDFKGAKITSATQAPVSRLLERRCGTLDCHGQVGRPLRIYGQLGLRFVDGDAIDVPGLQPTTDTEYEANYQSVIALQPEIMTQVYEQSLPPEALMLVRKPLQLERHKGGAVFVSGDDAYTCLTSWLESAPAGGGATDFDACGRATQ
jgi:hypothetical protein